MDKKIEQEVSKCKSVEEVIKLAEDNNYEISKEKAEEVFNKTHSNGELSDAELESVSGGGLPCQEKDDECYENVRWKTKDDKNYLFNVGDVITVKFPAKTAECTIRKRRLEWQGNSERDYNFKLYYYDEYFVDVFNTYVTRNKIVKK